MEWYARNVFEVDSVYKVLGRVIHEKKIKKFRDKMVHSEAYWKAINKVYMQGCATSTVPGSMPGVTWNNMVYDQWSYVTNYGTSKFHQLQTRNLAIYCK